MSERDQVLQWLEDKIAPPMAPRAPRAPRAPNADEAISQPFFSGVNTSDPAASALEIFRDPKNHVDATASILTFAGNKANFHPATQDISQAAQSYDNYIDKISTFPGFTLTFNERSQSFQSSVNIDLMIGDIKSAYEGVVEVDVTKVVDSVKRMANSVLSQSHADESRSLFNQMAIKRTSASTAVDVSIFYTTFHMKKDKSGKKTYTEQSYSINRTVFKVNAAVLVANAETFAESILKTPIKDWLDDSSTPTDNKMKSCFEKHLN
ncbi:hypothetical protein BC939DRAFT_500686 [Gamsiella multidivaricata]|uniref:uncharacterized protein n=1 Tax=Gamsiella multidivaricata TaxID=101098 RepID=UPI00221F0490|nr:uncharacterized protein BC939DRAFT_500686 [Gamsiella multidivaricata]KAG0369039.1 hypothetical protein BGZ54_000547 [Gamsiella multidivaricata]KAI7828570.1 hypothetical protein BC939DRAFT_500686 [Gamsiella multidivaricata]